MLFTELEWEEVGASECTELEKSAESQPVMESTNWSHPETSDP